MANILEVVQLGEPVLRQQAEPVAALDQQLSKLIEDLITTVRQTNGVGIAAPQVRKSQRLFIVASHPNPRYPEAPPMEPTAMINPKLLAHSEEMLKDWEGCLSIPGLRGLVPRYQEIEVEYTTPAGQLQKQILTNFVARIFQHELDHLNGVVFLDRLDSTHDLVTEQTYQNRLAASLGTDA